MSIHRQGATRGNGGPDPWRRHVESLLAACGLQLGGGRPQDPRGHAPRFFRRLMRHQLWQRVLSPDAIPGGWRPQR